MWYRRVLFGMLSLGLGLLGLAFGALFLLCLSLYVLWHGLSVSLIVFGGLGPACVLLARAALRRASAEETPELRASARALDAERESLLTELISSGRLPDAAGRRKIR
jgi:hypothetical protein